MDSSASPAPAITIRSEFRPGDLGEVLAMHGRSYAREYGFDERFEAHVARGLAGFATDLGESRDDPDRSEPGRLWIAERAGDVLGTVALTDEGDGVGQLRWFLVAPEGRGHGLGRRLLRALLAYARERRFTRVTLWTVHPLAAAARLYTEAGFRCTERHSTCQWGCDLDELRYELDLS